MTLAKKKILLCTIIAGSLGSPILFGAKRPRTGADGAAAKPARTDARPQAPHTGHVVDDAYELSDDDNLYDDETSGTSAAAGAAESSTATSFANPFKTANYTADTLVLSIPVGSTLITFNCGEGGSGSIYEALPGVKISVGEYETSDDVLRNLATTEDKDKPQFDITKGIKLFVNKEDQLFRDILELISIARTGKVVELPPTINLALRLLVLVNANLSFTELCNQTATLAARYKLSVMQEATARTPLHAKGQAILNRVIDFLKGKEAPALPTLPSAAAARMLSAQRRGVAATLPAAAQPAALASRKPSMMEDLWKFMTTQNINFNDMCKVERATLKPTASFTDRAQVAGKLIAAALHDAHNQQASVHTRKYNADRAYRSEVDHKLAQQRNNLAILASKEAQDFQGLASQERAKIIKAHPIPAKADNKTTLEVTLARRNALMRFYQSHYTTSRDPLACETVFNKQLGELIARMQAENEKLQRFIYAIDAINTHKNWIDRTPKEKQDKLTECMNDKAFVHDKVLEKFPNATGVANHTSVRDIIANANGMPLPMQSSRSELFSIVASLDPRIKADFERNKTLALQAAGLDKDENKDRVEFIIEALRHYLPALFA